MTAPPFHRDARRSPEKVRNLNAQALGVAVDSPASGTGLTTGGATDALLPIVIGDDDPIFRQVSALLADGYGGVVLRGPPGTSKSWYADQVAAKLTNGDQARVRLVQFHPSYQYEDFVEGFVPVENAGFRLRPKHLLRMCTLARDHEEDLCVLIVDELSRADPARVFGEALTYIERTKRDKDFRLASGRIASIPHNLFLLCTMNVFDRGVEQVDAALERRLGYVAMEPDVQLLRAILAKNSVEAALVDPIVAFFTQLQREHNPYCRIGHAYFNTVRDRESLQRLWDHQLRFVFERAFPAGDDQGFQGIVRLWRRMVQTGTEEARPAAAEPAVGVGGGGVGG